MVLSQPLVDRFLEFSGDRNRLHWDEAYAHRTPYGAVVVPGCAVVLAALGRVKGEPCARLRAEFKKPVLLGREYSVDVSEIDGGRRVLVSKGRTMMSEITVWRQAPGADVGRAAGGFGDAAYKQDDNDYAPAAQTRDQVTEAYALRGSVVGPAQLTALAWASYFTGMVYPGAQALLSSVDLVFDGSLDVPALPLRNVFGWFDDRFRRTVVTAKAPGVMSSAELTAFARPEPVQYSAASLDAAFPCRSPHPRTVMIAGGSRGLGSVLVRGCLRRGHRVVFTYWRDEASAKRIIDEAAQLGAEVHALRADLTSRADVSALRDAVRETAVGVLINSAAPPIRPAAFLDQTAEEFCGFVGEALRMTAQPTAALLPLLPAGGVVVMVSSAYARAAPAECQYAHYVAYKSAVEGMTRVLANEWPALKFVVARFPRLATDQTNEPFQLQPPVSPIGLAAALMDHVETIAEQPGENFREMDLGE